MRNKRFPKYPDDTDYNTNAPSYYDDLARKQKLIKLLSKRIWEYDKTLNMKLEEIEKVLEEMIYKIGEGFNEEIYDLLILWIEDGTLDHIINVTLMNKKADITYVDDEVKKIENTIENIVNQLSKVVKDIKNNENEIIKIDERITQLVSIKHFNVDPTGKKDSLEGFKNAFNSLKNNETLVLDTNGKYFLSDKLEHIRNGKINIEGNGSIILSDINNSESFEESRALSFKGVFKEANFLIGGIEKGKSLIKLSNTKNIEKGDLLHFKSDEQLTASRSYYKKGGVFTVGRVINDTQLSINGNFPYNISGSVNTIIDVYKPITVNIKDLTIIGNNESPAGYVGLALENSVNSKIENVSSDNFNHCFHFRKHVNTISNHLESGRSIYPNASESYGLASYIGTNFYLSNSVFTSGRHALEISGFENSFKTTINNVTAQSEDDTISFNIHQSSYDVVIKNSTFDSFGLAGHVVMENCTIGNKTSNIKTSNRYQDSGYVFTNCSFSGGKIRITDDAQIHPNNANVIGIVKFDNCNVSTRLQLDLFTSFNVIRTDRLIIRDTHDLSIRVLSGCYINDLFMENCTIAHNETFINSIGGKINEINISNSRLLERYKLFNMDDFNSINLNNIYIIPNEKDSGTGTFKVESKTSSGTPKGVINITNTDFSLLPISTGGFDVLNLINSKVEIGYGRSNITQIRESTMTDIK